MGGSGVGSTRPCGSAASSTLFSGSTPEAAAGVLGVGRRVGRLRMPVPRRNPEGRLHHRPPPEPAAETTMPPCRTPANPGMPTAPGHPRGAAVDILMVHAPQSMPEKQTPDRDPAHASTNCAENAPNPMLQSAIVRCKGRSYGSGAISMSNGGTARVGGSMTESSGQRGARIELEIGGDLMGGERYPVGEVGRESPPLSLPLTHKLRMPCCVSRRVSVLGMQFLRRCWCRAIDPCDSKV